MRNFLPYFIQQQYEADKQKGQFQAYTMFIDLSGFTPLTETLMQQGNVGAEQLSTILNNIFAPMVRVVYERDGFIPYYAGDAFTAIFSIENSDIDIESFLRTAQLLRNIFSKDGLQKTAFGDFQIGIKIGLSYGNVEWGIVGDKNKSFYFRGMAIDNCAYCQTLAQNQEIIFDKAVQQQIQSQPDIEIVESDVFRMVSDIPMKPEAVTALEMPILSKKVVAKFLPKAVVNYNQIGEFRSVISIFISFEKVDTFDTLNDFASIVIEQFNSFAGYFKEIDFGDKGGVMVGFFGAPVSFENNIERALEFSSALEEATISLRKKGLKYRIGITSGTAYTGIIGGKERFQYAVVGNQVNLAARLMSSANWGEVLVDEEVQKNTNFRFQHQGDIHYKGIIKDIPTYLLLGRNNEDKLAFSGKMIGREAEIVQLKKFIEPLIAKNQSAGIAYIYGEAGIGKSRLTFEVMRQIQEEGNIKWINCQADQILRKPFNPFVYFLRNYFKQSPENGLAKNTENFSTIFQQLSTKIQESAHPDASNIAKELQRTESVLAALVGIILPDSLWEQLDAKGRYQNILAALSNIFIAESILQAIIFELEDAHWFDDSSKEFLQGFLRRIQDYPFLFLITSRYLDDGSKPVLIAKEELDKYDIPNLVIDLNILKPEAIRTFAETKLEGKITNEFHKLLTRTTNGNPFYAEQIIEYFTESNLLIKAKDKWTIKDKNIKLSNSINSILMARIDRLSSLVKETVKAAAVIGREFEVPILSEVMKKQDSFKEYNGNASTVLREQIKTAEKGQIWQAMNELRYIFKHSLLREAVYDMQLHVRLRELHHRIAEAIEDLYGEHLEERYADLVFHYEQAEVVNKTKIYLRKAADFARRNFQNQQALIYYDKLLAYMKIEKETDEETKILLKKGSILELIGEWDKCEVAYSHAMQLASESDDKLLSARANDSLGKLLMLQGNYEKARAYLETAASIFENVDDKVGIVKVYGNLGNLYFRQGHYEEAKKYFIRSIDLNRAISEQPSNAQIVSNLGLTHMNQGNYQEGIQCQQEQLTIAERNADKQGMATLNTNMGIVYFEKGDYDSALACYEKGLALSEELGNKLLTTINIGCIGSVYERKGNYEKAMENFDKDLTLTQELGDKQGIAIAHGLLGDLLSIEGHFDQATIHLQEQLTLSEELGYQKGIAKALNTLGDVYAFQNDPKKAIHYYDRAIAVTRKIDNKLVLGSSLIEKADVLLATKNYTKVSTLQEEASSIAEQLGNPDLIFQATSLAARIAIATNKNDAALAILTTLLQNTNSEEERAEILYDLSQINPTYRQEALDLYQKLYEATPKFIYKLRLGKLK